MVTKGSKVRYGLYLHCCALNSTLLFPVAMFHTEEQDMKGNALEGIEATMDLSLPIKYEPIEDTTMPMRQQVSEISKPEVEPEIQVPTSIRELILSSHRGTILESVLRSGEGASVLAERMYRLMRLRASPDVDPNDMHARFREIYARLTVNPVHPNKHLPPGSLCLPLEMFPSYTASDAFRGVDGQEYLIVDFKDDTYIESRIVPMKSFVSYRGTVKQQREILDATDMLPLFFVNTDLSIGFVLAGTPNRILMGRMFMCSTWTSLKLRFAVRCFFCSPHRRGVRLTRHI
jgi:hypothetical protein